MTYFDCSIFKIVTFFTAIYFSQIDNIGPLISHFLKITNHRSIFFLKISIYIQIVIRLASIHRLSICIIDSPTCANDYQTMSTIFVVEVPGYCAAPASHVLVPGGVPDGQAGPTHLPAGLGARCLRRLHKGSTVYSLFATFKGPV